MPIFGRRRSATGAEQTVDTADAQRSNIDPSLMLAQTGMGSAADKGSSAVLQLRVITQEIAELLYAQFWAAKKLINIPCDDCWSEGRTFTSDDKAHIDKFEKVWDKYKVEQVLRQADKASRVHGGALVVIMPKNIDDAATELDIEKATDTDLSNLFVVDQWDVTIIDWQGDPTRLGFSEPESYWVFPAVEAIAAVTTSEQTPRAQIEVHHSRTLRFVGRRANTIRGWRTNARERAWGVSEFLYALDEILRDTMCHQAIAHLVQEASIPVHKVSNFEEAARGKTPAGELSLSQLAQAVNLYKSVYHTLFMGPDDEFDRTSVSFAGIPEIMQQFAARLAAVCDIPITRFLAQSPGGMNATGESDADNYAMVIRDRQKDVLGPHLPVIDKLVAIKAGISEPPDWRWLPLVDMSDKDKAEIFKSVAEGVVALTAAHILDEPESRIILAKTEMVDELGEWTPPPDPDPALIEAMMQKPPGAGSPPGAPKPRTGPSGAKPPPQQGQR